VEEKISLFGSQECDSEGEAMGSIQFVKSGFNVFESEFGCWYAIHTRARHEKRVAAALIKKEIMTFLPLVTEVHKWSDRNSKVEVPLFSCYAFVNIDPCAEARAAVLRVPGVLSFVGGNHGAGVIPDGEIESIQTLLSKNIPFASHSFLEIGQRVRVRGGALDGVEGVLTRFDGKKRLVLSVETIQRSLSLSVEGYEVEPVGPARKAS
jgi:transcriptional antiterminator RfaH